jgi:predicted nucleotidyltransferase component of viral defense system
MTEQNRYFDQASLMLNVLTSIQWDCFALKGGTAINFFYEQMPRYSVDIDLAYTKISGRAEALQAIHTEMAKIKQTLEKLNYKTVLVNADKDNPAIKLTVFNDKASIIIEPNTTSRGTLLPVEHKELTDKAVDIFKVSASVPCLAYPEVYAGKLCAMVSRQHPRDIFDMYWYWQKNQTLNDLIDCFIAYVIQSNRPFSELLAPNEQDITVIYESDFVGMVKDTISLDTLLKHRKIIFSEIKKSLTKQHIAFLLSMMQNKPDWSLMPFPILQKLPAIQWKLQNIAKISADKNKTEIEKLKNIFDS